MAARAGELPGWVNLGLLPLLNLAAAFFVSGLLVLLLGENPLKAVELLIYGAFGYGEAIGYTLYYATSFIFTGLAVAIAFHCGLFNIGGEGQAYLGGLGVALVGLHLGWLPFALVLPLAIAAAALFGGAWAFIPGWLQARRGSHVVITTIMFNFLAAALMTYLLVNVIIRPGQQIPRDRGVPGERLDPAAARHAWPRSASRSRARRSTSRSLMALVCCVLVWLFVWQTRCGYELRVVGQNEAAAVYGGISPARQIMLAMTALGRARGPGRAQHGPGRAPPPDPRLHRRRRLRRHRGLAHGPQPSGRHPAGGAPVRRPLSGRLGDVVRHAADHHASWSW